MQMVTTLAMAFPSLGTPSEAALKYNLFSAYIASLTGPQRCRLDLECLAEHNRAEKERFKEQQRRREADRKHTKGNRNISIDHDMGDEERGDILRRALGLRDDDEEED